MQIKSHGIVLTETPYNDRFSIVHILTPKEGCVSYRLPLSTANKSAARNLKRILYPLSEVHIVAEHRSGRSLQRLIEASPAPLRLSILMQPEKRSIALFLADLLHLVLMKQTDEVLYAFLSNALDELEGASKGVENFHIAFLISLLRVVGIAPDRESMGVTDRAWFSLQEAAFVPQQCSDTDISPEDAGHIVTLLRINYRNMHLYRYTAIQRRRIVAALLDFMRFHWIAFPSLKSTEVLSALYRS